MQESWDQYRRQMLEETSRFIEWALRHQDLMIEIPAKPADDGGFPAEVGQWFWTAVLTRHADSNVSHWRDVLLRRPKRFLTARTRRR